MDGGCIACGLVELSPLFMCVTQTPFSLSVLVVVVVAYSEMELNDNTVVWSVRVAHVRWPEIRIPALADIFGST